MKAKKSPRSAPIPPTNAPTTPLPTREQVQALAHAIWTDRGCPTGCDVEIWLEAERQLCGRTNILPAANLPANESVDPDRSEAGRIEREMGRIVSPPEQRSPTSL